MSNDFRHKYYTTQIIVTPSVAEVAAAFSHLPVPIALARIERAAAHSGCWSPKLIALYRLVTERERGVL